MKVDICLRCEKNPCNHRDPPYVKELEKYENEMVYCPFRYPPQEKCKKHDWVKLDGVIVCFVCNEKKK